MNTVVNQKIIHLCKATSNTDNIYGIVNKEAMYIASKNLSYNEFRIYMYMITNKDGYEFLLSTKDIADKMGGSKRELQRSINTLIKKGYLIYDSNNKYIFKEDILEEVNIGCVEKQHRCGENHHRGMVDSTTGCGENHHRGVVESTTEILHILQDNTFNNSDADANAANEKMNTDEQTEQPKIIYRKLKDVPEDVINKIIKLHKDGYLYSNKEPDIQNLTGVQGKIIHRIIEKYNLGEIEYKETHQENNDDILYFDENDKSKGYISVQLIKDTLNERNISEYDREDIYEIYGEYYEIALKYCDEQIVAEWFKKHFDYEYDKN